MLQKLESQSKAASKEVRVLFGDFPYIFGSISDPYEPSVEK